MLIRAVDPSGEHRMAHQHSHQSIVGGRVLGLTQFPTSGGIVNLTIAYVPGEFRVAIVDNLLVDNRVVEIARGWDHAVLGEVECNYEHPGMVKLLSYRLRIPLVID